jgi:hypothetical protein
MATPNLSIGLTSNGLRSSDAAHVKRLGPLRMHLVAPPKVRARPRVERL